MKIQSKLLKESAQPMGGDGKNFYMFYIREINSRKDVIDFAKDHGCDMIYWASDEAPYYGFKANYNGDTLVVFNSEDIDNIPDPYRQDAEEFGEPINESLTEDIASYIQHVHDTDEYLWNLHNTDYSWLYDICAEYSDTWGSEDNQDTIADCIRRMPENEQKDLLARLVAPYKESGTWKESLTEAAEKNWVIFFDEDGVNRPGSDGAHAHNLTLGNIEKRIKSSDYHAPKWAKSYVILPDYKFMKMDYDEVEKYNKKYGKPINESLLDPSDNRRYTVEYENTTGVGTYGQARVRELGHFDDLEDAIKCARNSAVSNGGYTIYVADEEKENREPVYKVVARWRGDSCKLEQSPGGTEYVTVDTSGLRWKIVESLNEATSKEILNALRTKKLSKDGFLQIGDAKTGWTAQIQDPGALELDMEHNSTKLKSGAWGRIWHHKKLVKQFHGPVNVVRDQMIKFFEGDKKLTEDREDLRSLARPNEMRILDIYYNYELNAEDILLGLLKYLPDNDLASYADDLEDMFEDADEEE